MKHIQIWPNTRQLIKVLHDCFTDSPKFAFVIVLINKRRKLEGKSLFKDIEAFEQYTEDQASKTSEDDEPDFIVKEGAEVLLDFIELKTERLAMKPA